MCVCEIEREREKERERGERERERERECGGWQVQSQQVEDPRKELIFPLESEGSLLAEFPPP